MNWVTQDGQELQRIRRALEDIRDVLIEASAPGLGRDAPPVGDVFESFQGGEDA
jgi:hypothetical protein